MTEIQIDHISEVERTTAKPKLRFVTRTISKALPCDCRRQTS